METVVVYDSQLDLKTLVNFCSASCLLVPMLK